MKARNKVKLKIAIYTGILVLYLLGFAAIFNYKTIFGIGYYPAEKNYSTTYSGGSGGLNIKMFARQISYDDHKYGLEITAFPATDSDSVGITYLDFRLATDTVTKKHLSTNYSIPVPTYSIGYETTARTRLFQRDNLTCIGFADVIFIVNDVEEIHRVYFDIGIVIQLDGEAIEYDKIALTWINVIYISCTAIPLVFLYRSYKNLRFMKWYSEEIRERDELFRDKLRKQEERATNR